MITKAQVMKQVAKELNIPFIDIKSQAAAAL